MPCDWFGMRSIGVCPTRIQAFCSLDAGNLHARDFARNTYGCAQAGTATVKCHAPENYFFRLSIPMSLCGHQFRGQRKLSRTVLHDTFRLASNRSRGTASKRMPCAWFWKSGPSAPVGLGCKRFPGSLGIEQDALRLFLEKRSIGACLTRIQAFSRFARHRTGCLALVFGEAVHRRLSD